MGEEAALERKPDAETKTVEDLVTMARGGELRVPRFQRPLEWTGKHVLELFDSVYRGFPIGVLLLWRHAVEAGPLQLGHVHIDAPESSAALSVVDGQQRLTSLVAGLTRPSGEPDPRFQVCFDAERRRFVLSKSPDETEAVWVPGPLLLDATELSEWMLDREPFASSPDLRRAAFDAGKRIREYRVPLYIVTTANEDVLRRIFIRINNAGKSLGWDHVHDALLSHRQGEPSTTSGIADHLATLGMGRPPPDSLVSVLVGARGLDPTRTLAEHIDRSEATLAGATEHVSSALRRTFVFLRDRCAVPHLRLLPTRDSIVVLGRFFVVFAEPEERTLELLTRWVWRGALTGEHPLGPPNAPPPRGRGRQGR